MGARPASAVVVGAGLAGLIAADRLSRAGVETVVVEARDRVGGRVWSQRLEGGDVVEMGAEFVLPEDSLVRETAARLRLTLFEKGTTYGNREPRGGAPVDPAALAAAHRAVSTAGAAGGLGDRSAGETLAQLVADPAAREVLLARLEVSGAAPAAEQADACLADGGKAFGDFPTHSIAGGNQLLAERLAGPLDGRLRLRAPAERIVSTESGVRIRAAGAELEADACVVAVPASVLGRIEFEPTLPAAVAAAFAAVGYGQAAKLFVPLKRPAPPSATLAVPERFWTFTQRDPAGRPLPVACSFAGSTPALARLAVEHGPQRWVERVAALRPDLALDGGRALLSTWADDPWVAGAYSLRSPGRALEHPLLTQPLGPIVFAGEHTAGDWHGLMEGALRSGVRAAGQLLEAGGR